MGVFQTRKVIGKEIKERMKIYTVTRKNKGKKNGTIAALSLRRRPTRRPDDGVRARNRKKWE